jgi:hypothetical protein
MRLMTRIAPALLLVAIAAGCRDEPQPAQIGPPGATEQVDTMIFPADTAPPLGAPPATPGTPTPP